MSEHYIIKQFDVTLIGSCTTVDANSSNDTVRDTDKETETDTDRQTDIQTDRQ